MCRSEHSQFHIACPMILNGRRWNWPIKFMWKHHQIQSFDMYSTVAHFMKLTHFICAIGDWVGHASQGRSPTPRRWWVQGEETGWDWSLGPGFPQGGPGDTVWAHLGESRVLYIRMCRCSSMWTNGTVYVRMWWVWCAFLVGVTPCFSCRHWYSFYARYFVASPHLIWLAVY